MTYRAGIATRARILDATRELLADGGTETTTVKAICERAGVLPGSFYNLFPSKDEVVMTVVRDAIASLETEGGPTETVSDLVNAFVRFVTSEPVIARVYLIMAVSGGMTDPAIRRRILRHHQARVDRLTAALRRRQSRLTSAHAAEQAEALVAALTGYALHAILDPDFDLPKHAAGLVSPGLLGR
ncbi:MAG: TetR/AcrR family transcriptional regulator [Acidimicrobiia bacterium]